MHLVDMAMGAARTPDTKYRHAEALCPLRSPSANVAHADNQQRLASG